MIRIAILLLLVGMTGISLRAQESPVQKPAREPMERMALRVNTRDAVMTCKGNSTHFRVQRRQTQVIDQSRSMQQRRIMMRQQRRSQQQQMQRQMQRRVTERQVMQQRQRMQQQKPGPGGRP